MKLIASTDLKQLQSGHSTLAFQLSFFPIQFSIPLTILYLKLQLMRNSIHPIKMGFSKVFTDFVLMIIVKHIIQQEILKDNWHQSCSAKTGSIGKVQPS